MSETNKIEMFEVSASPHIIKTETVRTIMRDVIIALIPAIAVSFAVFRWPALYVIALTTLFCVLIEFVFSKLILKKNTVSDLSCIVTGILLAMNLPSNVPWWIMLAGSFFAIVIGKLVFGGIGQNPFNPALVGRVVLLVSWPALMTTWPAPDVPKNFSDLFKNPDAVTAATPLGVLKAGGTKALDENRPDAEKTFASLKAGYEKSDSDKNEYSISKKAPLYLNLFLGNCGGSLGEISALALIIGGIYLFYKGHITFHIPASYLTTVIVISGIFWIADSAKYADPLFHILSGGVMLGALFMATDMTTTPIAASGMIIFGIGCGLITMTIRLFGSYPEGASFSILIMNALTPLIDRYAKPKRYGV